MNVKVHDIMTQSVITAGPQETIAQVRSLMEKNKIGAIPIVDGEGIPLGIISKTDFVSGLDETGPVESIMSEKVYTVPAYDDVSTAARVMRNHKIHRVVVTHEKKVIGVLSTFDVLKLVEGHRFVAKTGPTESKRKGSKRV
ncbi:MAG: CBS domain-containing protein [Gammaproteobacteria bacterium]